ncbi:MAG: NADH-quinone oxidoreductase subunit N [Flavobacteriaceae bacterium]|nr:NADH-quinone oxidoreductase subunit N [Flavobacteriaceae bacterium]
MNISNFLIMRHEIVLLVLILMLLVFEIFTKTEQKKSLIYLALGLFAIHTITGFFQTTDGVLFGGSYRTNELIHFFKNILNVGVLIMLLQSVDWLEKVAHFNKIPEFFILLFSSLIGMYFMISSGDFLMFYIGLELSTLPLVALVAYNSSDIKGNEAAIKLILSAALASAISLFGMTFIYATGGSIYFETIAAQLTVSPLAVLGLIFFFSGVAFKISLAPFHFWTADVYEGAPIGITSYLSVISKGAAIFILMTILFKVLPVLSVQWKDIVWGVAVLTMFVGNLFALRQNNMKRYLAFSSIAQAGFILMGIINAEQLGASTVIFFVMVYIFSNLGAFGVVQAISNATGKENMDDYTGLYRTNPMLSLVLLLSLFSLAGIPPVAGFFGKFFLYTAAAQKGYYLLVFLAVINVTISLYYYLLPVRAMFLRKSDDAIPYFKSPILMRVGLILAIVGIFVLGLYSPVYNYIEELSKML